MAAETALMSLLDDQSVRANPYPAYESIRAVGPAFRSSLEFWFVSSYPECDRLMRHPDLVRKHENSWELRGEIMGCIGRPWFEQQGRFMLFLDPPDHTRIRGLVRQAFTPRYLQHLRPQIEQRVDELLDRMVEGGGGDLINDLALPLPMMVICDMLGVPVDDRESFRRWTVALAATLEPFPAPEVQDGADEAIVEFESYFSDLIRARRGDPRDDLLSRLIEAEASGDKLNESELILAAILLLAAGFETTTNLIGNGTLALLSNRAQWTKLVEDPSLAPGAVEELLRYDSPVQLATPRVARTAVEVEGGVIEEGQVMIPMVGAGNRDPQRYENPEGLDITRRRRAVELRRRSTLLSGSRSCSYGGGGRVRPAPPALAHSPTGGPRAALEADVEHPRARQSSRKHIGGGPERASCSRARWDDFLMGNLPADERLADWARHIEGLRWPGGVFDAEWTLQWISPELRAFLGDLSDEEIGIGRHALEAFTQDIWLKIIHPDSQMRMFSELAPIVIGHYRKEHRDPRDVLPERFAELLDQVEPAPLRDVASGSFLYIDPEKSVELSDYGVNVLFVNLRDEQGEFAGCLMVSVMAVRPNLMTLLARGNEQMYERMARLIEPRARQAAILFCDLHSSGRLSRRLPSVAYFRLIRELWTKIDEVVADETGIVGKHAGDGASAYFLVDDLRTPSAAAAAAIRAARRIHELSEDVFQAITGSECQMKIGLHWGGSLYMGQLIPGSRLDVTALGDEVNETARLEDVADVGETVVSKQLLEQLTEDDAAAVGIDLEKVTYQLLAEWEGASEKVVRDAGGVAATTL